MNPYSSKEINNLTGAFRKADTNSLKLPVTGRQYVQQHPKNLSRNAIARRQRAKTFRKLVVAKEPGTGDWQLGLI